MARIEIGSIVFLTDPVFDKVGAEFEYGAVHLKKTGDPNGHREGHWTH
jgi:hypothetical protein